MKRLSRTAGSSWVRRTASRSWAAILRDGASLRYLLRWAVIAVISGVLSSTVVEGFRLAVRATQMFFISTPIPMPLVAIIGAVIAGAIVYRIEPESAGEGIPSYTLGLIDHEGRYPLATSIMKLPAAFLTLGTLGSGGMAGPLGRANAGILSSLFARIDRRTAAVCGMAATIGALFHAPIGAGVFAVEIIQRANMRYRDLFPAVLSSAVAVWVCRMLGWTPIVSIAPSSGSIGVVDILMLLALALAVGVASGLYTGLYALVVRIFRRNTGQVHLKVVAGTAVASTLVWLLNPALAGTAPVIVDAIFSNDSVALRGRLPEAMPVLAVAAVLLFLRAVTTGLTIGSGMSAGLLGPSMIVGLLSGFCWIELLGIPDDSLAAMACLAVGFAGILASSMNVPIAAGIMAIELFGPVFGLPVAFAVVIGFQINRHRTIYDFALAGSGHEGTGYHDK